MRLIQPLRHRPMALLWGGLALSAIGDQAYVVAMSWIAIDAFGPWAGWLVALGPVATILTVLFAGPAADRLAPIPAMVGMDAVRVMALLAVVAAWSATGQPSAVALGLTIVVLGAAQAIFRPALQTVLPGLVPDRASLPAANALLDATERIARLLGPALAGLLSGLVPLRHLFTLDAASFAASAAALTLMRRRVRIPARPPAPQSVLASMLHGARVTARVPLMGYVLARTGLLNGAWYATLFLALPLLIARDGLIGPGGGGLGAFGLVISAYGVTNLAGNLIVGSRDMPRRPGRQIFWANIILGVGLLGLAIVATAVPPSLRLPGYMLCAAFAAVGGPMQDIPVAVLRQTSYPAADIPAVMRAYLGVSQAGLLIGMAAAPALLALLPPEAVIALAGLAILWIGAEGLRRNL